MADLTPTELTRLSQAVETDEGTGTIHAVAYAVKQIIESRAQEIDTFRESNAGRAVETRRDAYIEAARIVRGATADTDPAPDNTTDRT